MSRSRQSTPFLGAWRVATSAVAAVAIALGVSLSAPMAANAAEASYIDVTSSFAAAATPTESILAVLQRYDTALDYWSTADSAYGATSASTQPKTIRFSSLAGGTYRVRLQASTNYTTVTSPNIELTGDGASHGAFTGSVAAYPTFTISGTVSGGPGGSGANVNVTALRIGTANGRRSVTSSSNVYTQSNGTYSISVRAGFTYAIQFDRGGDYSALIYPNIEQPSNFVPSYIPVGAVEIDASHNTSINATLHLGYSLSGTVTGGVDDTTEYPVVGLYFATGNHDLASQVAVPTATGATSAGYTFRGVPAGDYFVYSSGNTKYYNEGYAGKYGGITNQAPEFSNTRLQPIHIGNANVAGVDFSLKRIQPITVSGTVRDDSGNPVEGTVDVRLIVAGSTGGLESKNTVTDSQGRYTFTDVFPNDYYLSFNASSSEYYDVAYPNIQSSDPLAGDPIRVTATRTNLDVVLDQLKYYSISGTAAFSDGADWEYQYYLQQSVAGDWQNVANDDSSVGKFAFNHLLPGTYRVIVTGLGRYRAAVIPATLSDANLTGLSVTLQKAPTVAVSGHVAYDHSKTSHVTVSPYFKVENLWVTAGGVYVDSNGDYSIPLMSNTYRLVAEDSSRVYARSVYAGIDTDAEIATVDDATPVVVANAAVSVDPTTLHERPAITGALSDARGPLNFFRVELWKWNEQQATWEWLTSDYTEEDGSYRFTDVDPNSAYTLRVSTDYQDTIGRGGYLGDVGETMPPLPSAPAASVIRYTGGVTIQNFVLSTGPLTSGKITSSASSAGVDSATVTFYRWEDNAWVENRTTLTNSSGDYATALSQAGTYTLKASVSGLATGFLGGGTALPASPSATNSFQYSGTATPLAVITLAAKARAFGSIAGQAATYCTASSVPLGDDTTVAVNLGWLANFYGASYSSVVISTNGSVGFGREPSTVPNLSTTSIPTISVFGADSNTSNSDGIDRGKVTYGVGPDGTLCVVWNEIAAYSGAGERNTFQLMLSPRPDRLAGDFDITMNYDAIEWDRGGATAGFAAGSGAVGSFAVIAGTGIRNAFLNDGVNSLVGHSANSSQPGRYSYSVVNTPASTPPPTASPSPTPSPTTTPAPTSTPTPTPTQSPTPTSSPSSNPSAEPATPSGSAPVAPPQSPPAPTVSSTAPVVPSAVTPTTTPAAVLLAAIPKTTGTVKVGKTIKASVGKWTSGTKLKYQWYANGKAIKKATKSSFKITAALKGKKLSVKVTGTKKGFTTVAKASKATKVK